MLSRRELLLLGCASPFGDVLANPSQINAIAIAVSPLVLQEEPEQLSGLAVELIRELGRRIGFDVQITVQPRRRADLSFSQDRQAFLMPVARIPNREAHFRWLGPICPRRSRIFALSTRDDLKASKAEALDSIKHLSLAVNGGTATLEQLRAMGFASISETNSYGAAATMLHAGRVDLMAMDELNAYWQLLRLGEPASRIKVIASVGDDSHYYIVMHPDSDPALLARLNTELLGLRREGWLRRAHQRYGRAHAPDS